jgi:hypothetical protein
MLAMSDSRETYGDESTRQEECTENGDNFHDTVVALRSAGDDVLLL